jgi:hypothetical protein
MMIPKDRLRRLPISQPKVKWSVGASSCSRCSTTEVGISALASAGGVGFSSGLLTDASLSRAVGGDLGKPIRQLAVAAMPLDQPAYRVTTLAPALVASDQQRIELAYQVREGDGAVTGHGSVDSSPAANTLTEV